MSLIYLVVREQTTDTTYERFPERAYLSETEAHKYVSEMMPDGKGFDYTCPCGCGDKHYRSWDVDYVPLILPSIMDQQSLGVDYEQVIEDNFWELVIK